MKIVCDKCQTKYSIADEKVSGKVFKIRCKKCSHIIVVKGTEAAAESSAPEGDEGATVAGSAAAPLGDAGEKVWFLVVAGEQVGPFSGAEVRARFAAGEVDAETYSWREGFGDWLRLASIDEFRDLGAAANGAANGGETRRTDVGDMFAAHAAATQDDDGGAADIFGGAAARSAGGRAAAAPAPAAADDPFQGGRSSGDARSRASASVGAAAAQNDSKLTGQRNENSMLFSLNNLTAMATSGNAARSPSSSSSSPAPEARPGYATARNEGSGLIDIRAMAAATLSSSNGPSSSSLANDIPSFSAAPVFTPVVAAPVMMPVPQQGGLPKWAFALIGVGGLAFLGLGAGVIALLLKKDPPQVAVAPPVAAPVVAMAPTVAPTTPVAPAPGTTPVAAAGGVAGAAVAANGTPGGDAAKPAAAEHKAGGKAHDKPAPTRGSKPGAAAPAIPQPVRTPEPTRVAAAEKPRGKKSDGLDDLLNDAAPPTRAPKARPAEPPPPADDPSMPEQLDKSDVQGGMSGVKASVMACYGQFHVPGVALTSVTINKGRVTSATVGGALAGTPTGDCVEKAVKKASFKKAKQPLTVQYPFVLR